MEINIMGQYEKLNDQQKRVEFCEKLFIHIQEVP